MITEFRTQLASVVGSRDGMALEITRPSGERIAEVFEDDETKVRTFRTYTLEPLSLDAIEHLIGGARERL